MARQLSCHGATSQRWPPIGKHKEGVKTAIKYAFEGTGLSLIFTIPFLGLVAHRTAGNGPGPLPSVDPMGIFVSVYTLTAIPIMLVLPEVRKNTFWINILSELIQICVLWILWVVVAALAIQQQQFQYPLDNCSDLPSDILHWCNELFAMIGLSVVIFVLLLKCMLFLTIYAIVMTFRAGGRVWFQSIKDVQIRMPQMVNATGDLESKARHNGSSTSIPMANGTMVTPTYSPPPTHPGPQPQLSQQVQYAPVPQYDKSRVEIQEDSMPSRVAMQVIPAQTLGRPNRPY